MTNLKTTYLSFLPLVSRVGADARVLPLVGVLDFTLDTQYVIDLTAAVQSSQLQHGIQACFLDGMGSSYGPMMLQVFGTGQTIYVPAGVQGYYSLLCTSNSFQFSFTNLAGLGKAAGTAFFQAYFLNVPYVSGAWSLAGGGGYGN